MDRLAVISPRIGAKSETFIRRHMTGLHDGTVVVAGTCDPPYCGHWSLPKDVPFLLLQELNSFRDTPGAPLSGAAEKALSAFLGDHDVEVMLVEFLDFSLQLLDLARRRGARVFCHAHGYDVSRSLIDGRWRREYSRLNTATGVIAPSIAAARRLMEAGIRRELIHVVPYGVSVPDALLVRDSDCAPFRFVSIGRLVSKKSPLALLEAFLVARRSRDDVELHIVGDGPFMEAAVHFVCIHKLTDCVALYGALEHDDALRVLRSCDCYVQHSVTCPVSGDQEGMPVSILEAMASGLPVVSTVHAGIPESVCSSRSGILVAEFDAAGMGAAMAALASDRQMSARLGAAAYEDARRRFSWQKERASLCSLMGISELGQT